MPTRPSLLVVEPDASLRRALTRLLSDHYAVSASGKIEEALALLSAGHLDVVLADADVANVSAFVTRIRALRPDIPVLMMTSAPGTIPRGAVPVQKPIRLAVLTTQISGALHDVGVAASVDIGPYEFFAGSRLLRDRTSGRSIRLTEKEAGILKLLANRRGRVTGRDELLTAVWGYASSAATHTVETHIYRLRRKIEADPGHAALLVSEPGGYRLCR
jgi:DNA-binding response OmpR family regulator